MTWPSPRQNLGGILLGLALFCQFRKLLGRRLDSRCSANKCSLHNFITGIPLFIRVISNMLNSIEIDVAKGSITEDGIIIRYQTA